MHTGSDGTEQNNTKQKQDDLGNGNERRWIEQNEDDLGYIHI